MGLFGLTTGRIAGIAFMKLFDALPRARAISVLFHAGADLMIILGIFGTYGVR